MFRSPQQMLRHWEEHAADFVPLHQPIERTWHEYSWGAIVDQARRMAAALGAMGLRPGDRVAIISKNCAHWMIADYAIMAGAFVSVPIYPTANARTITYVLEHSESKACFVGKLDDFEPQLEALESGPPTIAFPYAKMPCTHRWDDLVGGNARLPELASPGPDDVATLIYTSGSTGNPKGAVHTYRSFEFAGTMIGEFFGVTETDRVLSYLPLAHCTERAYVEACNLYNKYSLYFTESLATFADDLKHARPTSFGSVPRLWKKFQLGILGVTPERKLEMLLRLPLVSGLVRNKIRQSLGLDQARWFGSGTAPIAPALLKWWESLDMPLREGWGMTETFAVGTSVSPHDEYRFGTIGKALPGTELKIGDNDEILIKCPCMMTGYHKEPELTAAAFTEDGYLRTGDCGSIDPDGYVRITGRAKEIFKTSKGKYVAPVPIESLLAQNPLVEQACVVGIGMPQPVALVQLAEGAAENQARAAETLKDTMTQVNGSLESHERLDRIIVVADEWTPENGLLTPTLKLKRDRIESRYSALIEKGGSGIEFEASVTPTV